MTITILACEIKSVLDRHTSVKFAALVSESV